MRLIWAAAAHADLDAIVRYIAYDNVTAAFGVEDRIRGAVERLIEMPQSGRAGFKPGTRELIVPGMPYIVTYQVGEDAVEILHVTHGRRQWPPAQ